MNEIEHRKERAVQEVMLRLGGAVLFCQHVEHAIYAFLLCLAPSKLAWSSDDFFSADQNKTGPALGKLEKALKEVAELPSGFSARLKESVHLRNRVIHRLFAESSPSEENETEKAQTKLAIINSLIKECDYFLRVFLGALAHLRQPELQSQVRLQESQIQALMDAFKPAGAQVIQAVLKKHAHAAKGR
jgi:hypothetical protein